jgi:hypothetical protein
MVETLIFESPVSDEQREIVKPASSGPNPNCGGEAGGAGTGNETENPNDTTDANNGTGSG